MGVFFAMLPVADSFIGVVLEIKETQKNCSSRSIKQIYAACVSNTPDEEMTFLQST